MRVLLLLTVLVLSACATASRVSTSIASCKHKLADANATMCATDWVVWGVDCKKAGTLQQECSNRLAKAKAARGNAAVMLVELGEYCPTLDTNHRDCAL
jgi:hypothetical protein